MKIREISVKVKADFTGGSIDEMNGEINIDSLSFAAPETQYFLDNPEDIRHKRKRETRNG